jgi:hypothetical protein
VEDSVRRRNRAQGRCPSRDVAGSVPSRRDAGRTRTLPPESARDGGDADTLLTRSDAAVYEAKRAAKGTIAPYEPAVGPGTAPEGLLPTLGRPARRNRTLSTSRPRQSHQRQATPLSVGLESLLR